MSRLFSFRVKRASARELRRALARGLASFCRAPKQVATEGRQDSAPNVELQATRNPTTNLVAVLLWCSCAASNAAPVGRVASSYYSQSVFASAAESVCLH